MENHQPRTTKLLPDIVTQDCSSDHCNRETTARKGEDEEDEEEAHWRNRAHANGSKACFAVLLFLGVFFGLMDWSNWLARNLHQPLLLLGSSQQVNMLAVVFCGIVGATFVVFAVTILMGPAAVLYDDGEQHGRLPFCMLILFLLLEEFVVSSILTPDTRSVVWRAFALGIFSSVYVILFIATANRQPPHDINNKKGDYITAVQKWKRFAMFRMLAFGWIVLCQYFVWMPQMEHHPNFAYKGPMHLSNIATVDKHTLVSGTLRGSQNNVTDLFSSSKRQFLEFTWGSSWDCPGHCTVSLDFQPFGTNNLFTSYTSGVLEQFLKAYNVTESKLVPWAALETPADDNILESSPPHRNQGIWIQGDCHTCTLPVMSAMEAESFLSAAIYAMVFGYIFWRNVWFGILKFA